MTLQGKTMSGKKKKKEAEQQIQSFEWKTGLIPVNFD